MRNIDLTAYLKIRYLYQKCSQLAYQNYLSDVKSNHKTNPQFFWDFINIKRKSNGVPTFMRFNDKQSESDEGICNFLSTFSNLCIQLKTFQPTFQKLQLQSRIVFQILSKL